MKPFVLASGLVAVLALAGCNRPSSDEAAASHATTVTVASFCQGVFGAAFDAHDPGCPDVRPVDADSAMMLRLQIANCKKELGASVSRNRAKLDPVAGAACITAIRDGEIRRDHVEHWKTAVCDAIGGLQATGLPCRQTWECAAPLACVGFTHDKDGTCSDPPTTQGAACGVVAPGTLHFDVSIGTRTQCGKGFYCSINTCESKLVVGEACGDDKMCAEGLACRVGHCARPDRLASGAACEQGEDCAEGLTCLHDPVTKTATCGARKSAGTACDGDDDCKGRCEKDACVSWCKSG